MTSKKLLDYSKHVLAISLIIIALLTFLIIKPFITYILSGLILAYMLHPINKRLKKVVRSHTLAAILMILFVLIIILLPLFFVGNKLIEESFIVLQKSKNVDLGFISDKLSKYFGSDINANFLLKDLVSRFVSFVISLVPNYIVTIPQKIVGFFIMIFIMFYLFRDGTDVLHYISRALPIRNEYKNKIRDRINKIVFGFFDGLAVIALIQGTLAFIGFKIFGISSPLVLAIIVAILSFIPVLGSPLVYLPVVLIELLSGNLFNGIALLIYSIIFISGSENLLKPVLLGDRLGLHPVFMLLGMFGGISLFGVFGIIIGPIIIAIFLVFFEIYMEEYDNKG